MQLNIEDIMDLPTPVGLHGAVHQADVAGDSIFSIVIGVVVGG